MVPCQGRARGAGVTAKEPEPVDFEPVVRPPIGKLDRPTRTWREGSHEFNSRWPSLPPAADHHLILVP